ncbi:unnamed protein product [Sphacelaria rigidula]
MCVIHFFSPAGSSVPARPDLTASAGRTVCRTGGFSDNTHMPCRHVTTLGIQQRHEVSWDRHVGRCKWTEGVDFSEPKRFFLCVLRRYRKRCERIRRDYTI